jgi:hypothetical protein
MIRKAALMGGAEVLVLIGISATGDSAHAIYNPPGFGITHCNAHWTGTLSFSPGLTNGGTATSETVTLGAVDKPCTGGTPAPVAMTIGGSGTITGTGANDCNHFFFLSPPGTDTLTFSPSFAGAIHWTPTSIFVSPYSFPSATMKSTTVTAPVIFTATNVAVTVSYPITTGKIKFNSIIPLSSILTTCNTPGTLLPSLRIAAAGSVGKI